MKRINVEASATLKELYDVVFKTLNLIDYGFSLFADRGLSKEIRSTRSETIKSKQLKHGDVVYYKQSTGSSVSWSSLFFADFITIATLSFHFLVSVDTQQQHLGNAGVVEKICKRNYRRRPGRY